MTDIVNLNSIRSDNCDCNKPKKPSCGCNNHNFLQSPIDLSGSYFKVKNLFNELKAEWQRAEARLNLGVTDIIDVRLTESSDVSGGTNKWTMEVSKGGSNRLYDFIVKNGKLGEKGEQGESAYDIYVKYGGILSEPEWKESLKGEAGEKGEKGDNGLSAYEIAQAERALLNLDPQSISEWLGSLIGPKGEKGDKGIGIEGFLLHSVVNKRVLLPNEEYYEGPALVWRAYLTNDEYVDFWVPLAAINGGNQSSNTERRYNVFLFKLGNPLESGYTNATLLNEQSGLQNSLLGKTVDEAIALGWSYTAPVVLYPGYQYLYMATCVVTNEQAGNWSVMRVTGDRGAQGDPGEPGPLGPDGTSTLGLIGPVIRFMGEYNSGTLYVNQTYKPYTELTEIHYIDVVAYRESETDTYAYYQVKADPNKENEFTTLGNIPTNTTFWNPATYFNFAFIETLIANHISSDTVDTREIRILNNNSTLIVAGMTSGEGVTDTEESTSYSPVRIWAGTGTVVSENNSNPSVNVAQAKFRVHQNGHLYAGDADIEGIVTANTLRLGLLDSTKHIGSFSLPANGTTSLTLPELVDDKTLTFYILTNLVTADITVNRYGNDTINDMNGNSGTSFTATPNKLYLLFGFSNVWYVVEQDILAASSISNEEEEVSPIMIGDLDLDFCLNWTVSANANDGNVEWDPAFTGSDYPVSFIMANNKEVPIQVSIPKSFNVYLFAGKYSTVGAGALRPKAIYSAGYITISFNFTNSSYVTENASSYDVVLPAGYSTSSTPTYAYNSSTNAYSATFTLEGESFTLNITPDFQNITALGADELNTYLYPYGLSLKPGTISNADPILFPCFQYLTSGYSLNNSGHNFQPLIAFNLHNN